MQKCCPYIAQRVTRRYLRGTIIESEDKVDDIDYLVFCKRDPIFWIYISSNIRVCPLYLSDSLSIQPAQCHLWLSSICSLLRHSMKIAILIHVQAKANHLARSRHTIDWWGTVLFIYVAWSYHNWFTTGLDCLIGFSLLTWNKQRCFYSDVLVAISAICILPCNIRLEVIFAENCLSATVPSRTAFFLA